jgi:hypothetical protein
LIGEDNGMPAGGVEEMLMEFWLPGIGEVWD